MDYSNEHECLAAVSQEIGTMRKLTQALHEAIVEPSTSGPPSVGGQIIPLVHTKTIPPQLLRVQSKG